MDKKEMIKSQCCKAEVQSDFIPNFDIMKIKYCCICTICKKICDTYQVKDDVQKQIDSLRDEWDK